VRYVPFLSDPNGPESREKWAELMVPVEPIVGVSYLHETQER